MGSEKKKKGTDGEDIKRQGTEKKIKKIKKRGWWGRDGLGFLCSLPLEG